MDNPTCPWKQKWTEGVFGIFKDWGKKNSNLILLVIDDKLFLNLWKMRKWFKCKFTYLPGAAVVVVVVVVTVFWVVVCGAMVVSPM